MSKLTYAQMLIKQLTTRIERINETLEKCKGQLSESDTDALYAKRQGFIEARALAKTVYTKMSRGTL